jgi:hypothetical protein
VTKEREKGSYAFIDVIRKKKWSRINCFPLHFFITRRKNEQMFEQMEKRALITADGDLLNQLNTYKDT